MKTEIFFVEELSLEELMSVKGGTNQADDKDRPIQIYCQGTPAVSCSGSPAVG